jgi:hypothetical protein
MTSGLTPNSVKKHQERNQRRREQRQRQREPHRPRAMGLSAARVRIS